MAMLPDSITTEEHLTKVIQSGLTEMVHKIVDEEADAASKRVVERVGQLKENAVQNILTRFKVTQRTDYPTMELVVKFNL